MADHDRRQRERMVSRQIEARGVSDARVLAAMRAVPRSLFVPGHLVDLAHDDAPLPIAEGQTISQPYIVALMIEAACVAPDDRVLEVGTGSGYAAAVLAHLAGHVFTIERHGTLADSARQRLTDLGYGNVTVLTGDGSRGLPDAAPFDAILVAARSRQVPAALSRQLTAGGRLVIPIGGEDGQTLYRFIRTGEESWHRDDLGRVRFVPLIRFDTGVGDGR